MPALKKDPVNKILMAGDKAAVSNMSMNKKLIQILQRSDFDRPVLMLDKMDYIWDKQTADDKIVDKTQVQLKLQKRKHDREQANRKQEKVYNQLLQSLQQRQVPRKPDHLTL